MSTTPSEGEISSERTADELRATSEDELRAVSEDEMRAAYEEQLSRVSSAEMALQAAVSLLAVGGRRLGLVPGSESSRDLEQVRDAIDGVRALLPILERRLPQELGPLREALSQLQMAYAREAQASAATSAESQPQQERGSESQAAAPQKRAGDSSAEESEEDKQDQGPGPAQASGRLWVPGR
jgi:hypothetical protein